MTLIHLTIRLISIRALLIALFILVCSCLSQSIFAQTTAFPDRATFCRHLASIKPGMTEEQVIGLLGQPDDVVTGRAFGRMYYFHKAMRWCYGTNGHMSLPTLGSVYIGNGKAVYTLGGEGDPPPEGMFAEPELRSLLRTVDEMNQDNEFSSDNFDPRACIGVVNTLLPLGKTKALAVLSEYVRLIDSQPSGDAYLHGGDVIYWIDRVLFQVPEDPGYLPLPQIGGPVPDRPTDARAIPAFPLIIVDDVPLMLPVDFMLGGRVPQPEEDISYFRVHGVLRDRLLMPPADPFAILEKVNTICDNANFGASIFGNILGTKMQWDSIVDRTMKVQIVKLVDPSLVENDANVCWEQADQDLAKAWIAAPQDMKAQNLSWNAALNRYTTPQGTYSLAQSTPLYSYSIWWPKYSSSDLVIDVIRQDDNLVAINTSCGTVPAGKAVYVKVISLNSSANIPEDSIAWQTLLPVTKGDHSDLFQLPADTSVQITATQGSITQTSPVYAP
jgi:hypothetical protein